MVPSSAFGRELPLIGVLERQRSRTGTTGRRNYHVRRAQQNFLDDLRQLQVIGVSMPDVVSNYVFSIQAEPYHREVRYHWMICSAQNPDQMVSWGHASTRELAEAAAQNEIQDLSSGLTQGGRVISTKKQTIRRR
jgi:hypothetical protein